MRLAYVPVFVSDQQRALEFFRDKLGFDVTSDQSYGEGRRWLAVAPRRGDAEILLYDPRMSQDNPDAESRVGTWTGFVFQTEDVRATYDEWHSRGVEFEAEPQRQPWGGFETWFRDPDGNRFHLAQVPGS
jgi:lactoylglutathione lyase